MKIECDAFEKIKLMESIQFSRFCPFGHDDCQKPECYNCLNDMIDWKIVDEELPEWCTDCKEYDQKAHCCHRWTNQIRRTIDDLKNKKLRRLEKLGTKCKILSVVPPTFRKNAALLTP